MVDINLQSVHAIVRLEVDLSVRQSRDHSMAGTLDLYVKRLIDNAPGLYFELSIILFWQRFGEHSRLPEPLIYFCLPTWVPDKSDELLEKN